jgi:hypothetical protein
LSTGLQSPRTDIYVADDGEVMIDRTPPSPGLIHRKRGGDRMRRIGVKARIGFILVAAFLAVPLLAGQALAGAGKTTQISAFYDGNRVTINIFEQPSSERLLASNKSLNTIYVTNDLDEEQDFTPVIDAIQGDGFNPLWHQVLIVFNAGFAPHQFLSDDQVLEAAAAGEITLVPTDEVYICAVVGPK